MVGKTSGGWDPARVLPLSANPTFSITTPSWASIVRDGTRTQDCLFLHPQPMQPQGRTSFTSTRGPLPVGSLPASKYIMLQDIKKTLLSCRLYSSTPTIAAPAPWHHWCQHCRHQGLLRCGEHRCNAIGPISRTLHIFSTESSAATSETNISMALTSEALPLAARVLTAGIFASLVTTACKTRWEGG